MVRRLTHIRLGIEGCHLGMRSVKDKRGEWEVNGVKGGAGGGVMEAGDGARVRCWERKEGNDREGKKETVRLE